MCEKGCSRSAPWNSGANRRKVFPVKALLAAVLLFATNTLAQQSVLTADSAAQPKPLSAQQLSESPTDALNRVSRSMGRYARDVSEIRLNVQTAVRELDTSGNEKSRKTSSHFMQFVKRSYTKGSVLRRLQVRKHGLHRVSADEMNADSATALLSLLFDKGAVSGSNAYNLVLHTLSRRLEVKIVDGRLCEGFDPSVVPDTRSFCGETILSLDSTTLDPIAASFNANGFPRIFGKVRYNSFAFTEEFQKVLVEGSAEPFLLPARVVVTYETDAGRTVVESTYSLRVGTISSTGSNSS
jgi:hypothetical protein